MGCKIQNHIGKIEKHTFYIDLLKYPVEESGSAIADKLIRYHEDTVGCFRYFLFCPKCFIKQKACKHKICRLNLIS